MSRNATIVNVPEAVKVCIVCPPTVVIVPPVEVVETQSLPLVAYETITTPEPETSPVVFTDAPDPPPVLATPFHPTPVAHPNQAPAPVPPVPPVVPAAPPPADPYMIAAQLIELLVPFGQAHPTFALTPLAPLAESLPPPAPPVTELHPINVPLPLFHPFDTVVENKTPPFPPMPVRVEKVELLPFGQAALFAPAIEAHTTIE